MAAVALVGGALLLCAAYSAICIGVGLGVARLVGAWIDKPGTHAFILGQAVLGILWQSLAGLGAFSVGAVLLAIVAGVTPSVLAWRRWFSLVPARLRDIAAWVRGLDWWWRAIVAATLSALALYAVLTCSFPGIDAVSFYLPQAKVIAAAGAFVPLSGYALFAQIGFIGEMHFAALYLFGGDAIGGLAAKMFVWPTALAIGGVLWAMVGELGGSRRAQWAALALVYSSTAVTNIIWDGKSDLFAAAYGIAALHWALRIARPGETRATFLAGFLGGTAVVAKLSFLVVLPPALAVIAIGRLARERGAALRILRHAGIGAAAFAGALLCLGFKNALVFGEPLAPFVMLRGGDPGFLEQAWFSPENTRFIVLTYPLALLFGQYPMQHGDLSALWLAVLPLALLMRREIDRDLLLLTLASIIAVVCWAVLRPSVLATRYILPPLLGLLPLAAIAAEIPWRRASLAWARPAVATAFLGLMAMSQAYDVFFHLRPTLADIAMSPPYGRNPLWQQAEEANRDLAPGGRLYLLQSQRSVLRADLLQCILLESELDPAVDTAAVAGASFFERVHAHGASLVLVDRLTHGMRFDPADAGVPPPWLAVERIEFGERFMVYRVTPAPDAPAPRRRCEPDGEGGWRVVPTAAAGG